MQINDGNEISSCCFHPFSSWKFHFNRGCAKLKTLEDVFSKDFTTASPEYFNGQTRRWQQVAAMKLFPTSVFLIFVILREIECPLPKLPSIPGMDLSNMSSVFSLWNKSTSDTGDANTKGTGDEKESATMKERFQNMLLSNLPQVSDELQLQFLVAIRVLLGNSFPMAGWIITPLIDEVIAKYEAKVPNSAVLMMNPDTTDALIFKLMSQKVDDKNLNEFLEIGADSYVVKEVTSRFMKSLQLVADNYVDNYLRDIKEKVEKKLAQ